MGELPATSFVPFFLSEMAPIFFSEHLMTRRRFQRLEGSSISVVQFGHVDGEKKEACVTRSIACTRGKGMNTSLRYPWIVVLVWPVLLFIYITFFFYLFGRWMHMKEGMDIVVV